MQLCVLHRGFKDFLQSHLWVSASARTQKLHFGNQHASRPEAEARRGSRSNKPRVLFWTVKPRRNHRSSISSKCLRINYWRTQSEALHTTNDISICTKRTVVDSDFMVFIYRNKMAQNPDKADLIYRFV